MSAVQWEKLGWIRMIFRQSTRSEASYRWRSSEETTDREVTVAGSLLITTLSHSVELSAKEARSHCPPAKVLGPTACLSNGTTVLRIGPRNFGHMQMTMSTYKTLNFHSSL